MRVLLFLCGVGFASVSPVLEKTVDNCDGNFVAYFGYNNTGSQITIPIGDGNKFTGIPSGQNQGQPVTYLPCRHVRVFSVIYSGNNAIVWTLQGKTSTAYTNNIDSRSCSEPVCPVDFCSIVNIENETVKNISKSEIEGFADRLNSNAGANLLNKDIEAQYAVGVNGMLVTKAAYNDEVGQLYLSVDSAYSRITLLDNLKKDSINIPNLGNIKVPIRLESNFESSGLPINRISSIATDNKQTFWVADPLNNRILRFKYNRVKSTMDFMGHTFGINGRAQICFLRTENQEDEKLVVLESSVKRVRLISPWFMGEDSQIQDSKLIDISSSFDFFDFPEFVKPDNSNELFSTGQPSVVWFSTKKGLLKRIKFANLKITESISAQLSDLSNGIVSAFEITRDGGLYFIDQVNNKLLKYNWNGIQLTPIYRTGTFSEISEPGAFGLNNPFQTSTFNGKIIIGQIFSGNSGAQQLSVDEKTFAGKSCGVPTSLRLFINSVVNNCDGTYTAIFGYENRNTLKVCIPDGKHNTIYNSLPGQSRLYTFNPGIVNYAHSTKFNSTSVSWNLDGQTIVATKAMAKNSCSDQKSVTPVLESVKKVGSTYEASFGYLNRTTTIIEISIGLYNKFSYKGTTNLNKGQPIIFEKGRKYNVFKVIFDGSPLVWTLGNSTATASK